jgi:uncharacterized glyoxalase superfamily protein PhnB
MNEGQSRGALLRAGDVHIAIRQGDFPQGRSSKGEGFTIYCETRQDIERLAEEMKARGAKLEHEPRQEPWGSLEFAVIDPDGFRITLAN